MPVSPESRVSVDSSRLPLETVSWPTGLATRTEIGAIATFRETSIQTGPEFGGQVNLDAHK